MIGIYASSYFLYQSSGIDPVTASIKMFLEGPYVPSQLKMNASLKGISSGPLFPTTEPYSGYAAYNHVGDGGMESLTFGSASLAASQVVDWVFVELRDKNNPSTVVSTRSGLLLQSGSVVDIDGSSSLVFSTTPKDNYYVAVRHRNHLGCMTSESINFNLTYSIDFTTSSLKTYGTSSTSARKLIGTGIYGLYAGDITQNGIIRYASASWEPTESYLYDFATLQYFYTSRSLSTLTAVPGYYLEDVNLDGNVKYSGANNDRSVIQKNVGLTTPTASKGQELP